MGLMSRFSGLGTPRLPTPGGKAGREPLAIPRKALGGVLRRLDRSEGPPDILTPRVTRTGSWEEWWHTISNIGDATPAKLFSEQPHLRTAVTFRARNTAQLGLHVFERVDDNDRRRDRTSTVAQAIQNVDGVMTTYELVFSLVGDLDLYDRAHWLVIPSDTLPSGWMIRRLPPAWVVPEEQTAFEVKKWRVTYGRDSVVIDAKHILSFTGYSPTDPRRGSPTVESLRNTLQEQIEAALYRSQVWKRGGRVSAVLERPTDAPRWSDGAREAFREDWYAKFTGRGSKAGGTPILEDGMTLKRIDFNAQEQQYVEAAKLSLVTVASAYHINPTMIGQNEGATHSNVREFRKMLYGDTLGPLVAQIEARLNAFLIPKLGGDPTRTYVEFNIEEKLQGNFEEQADAFQAAAGGPWMTRNEVRAMRNLPRVEGGDELIIPLNVLIGGQASPVDGGQTEGGGASGHRRAGRPGQPKGVKANVPETYREQAQRVIATFFERQGQAVRSRLGAGQPWWDSTRWDSELRRDILALYQLTATQAGRSTLTQLGIDPELFDEPRTQAFLAESARISAEEMNQTTHDSVEKALEEDDEDPVAAAGHVFSTAISGRAPAAAAAIVTFAAAFGSIEAARQQAPTATKTWVVNSTNPRDLHASMNGETVGIGETFSNGLDFPGAFGPPDQVAGCQCSVSITIPSP